MTSGSCVFAIVDRGKANDLLHRAQQIGARRGTIFLGEGTMSSRWADWLGISQTQKEVLLIALPDDAVEGLYAMMREEFQLHKRYKGIAFSVPYRAFDPEHPTGPLDFGRMKEAPHVCLMAVLKRGLGEECMAHAKAAGARGGTILHAHGAGVPQDFYFPLVIEPQKDIVLIVAPRETAPRIRDTVYTRMRLERKGSGILFALPVVRTLGLYEQRQGERADK